MFIFYVSSLVVSGNSKVTILRLDVDNGQKEANWECNERAKMFAQRIY